MSEVNLDFTVSNNSIDFTVEPNDITITPTDIQLTFYNSAPPTTGGGNGQVQYNNFGQLGGIPTANYNGSNLTLEIANTKITGGNNHYYLQTDGTGNLTWAVGTGNMQGNGTVAGANSQIQFNDGGANFGGNAGFTFERITGNVNIPGNLIVVGNVFANVTIANYAAYAGNVVNTNQPNITSLGTLVTLNVAGNITSQNANLGNLTTSNYFSGSGNLLSNIQGANISGAVPFASVANSVAGANVSGQVANALVASTVYTNAQPNITSFGNLSSFTLQGTGTVQQIKEKITSNSTAATGTINYDLLTQAIILNTANATTNFTLNFRGNSTTTLDSTMSSNQSMTCTFINPNGATPYYPIAITVDGNSVVPLWQGNSSIVPTAYANTTSMYTFNIIKLASNSFKIFGAGTGYS